MTHFYMPFGRSHPLKQLATLLAWRPTRQTFIPYSGFFGVFLHNEICARSSFAIILKRKRELTGFLLLSKGYLGTGNVL